MEVWQDRVDEINATYPVEVEMYLPIIAIQPWVLSMLSATSLALAGKLIAIDACVATSG